MHTFKLLQTHEPGGTSTMNVEHWIQCVKKGQISKFDYGRKKNL